MERERRRMHRHALPIAIALTPVFQFEAGGPYRWQNIHDFIERLCEENGLGFLDLYASFRGSASSDFALDSWHPNALGHAVIASALADYVGEYDGVERP